MTHSADDTAPAFVTPPSILDMKDEEIDLLLERIRLVRMQKHLIYTETKKEKERIHLARLETKMELKGKQFERQLAAVDKAIDKLDLIANEIRGMRLQMLLDPM